MKTIIIFGGTGGVGAYTCIRLIEQGYLPIIVGNRKNDNGFFESKGCKYFSVDITKQSSFDVLPSSEVYAIIHLAGLMPARMKGYNPQLYIDCNMTGTLNVLQYAEKVKCKRFVFAQSKADLYYMMGTLAPVPADAESKFPLNTDHSVYSITKTAAVHLVEHYANKCNFIPFILRICNITLYHPNRNLYIDGKLRHQGFWNVVEQIQRGEDIELWGSPDCQRDMFYVKDMAQIIQCCLEADSKGGIYNVGTGKGTSRYEQLEVMIEVFSNGSPHSHILINTEKPNSPQYIMDVSKTIMQLGYHPEYDFKTMMIDYKHEMETNPFEAIWGKESDYPLV